MPPMLSAAVPLNDLSRGLAEDRHLVDEAIARVLDSGWFVLGNEVAGLEEELAVYLGAGDVVSVANGTDALALSLLALGCQPGDRVATVANAGAYATTAIRMIGAVPVYVDVDSETALLTTRTLDPALELGVSIVVATHLYGGMVDLAPIIERCHRKGVRVLEDCAQAVGATRDGRRAGSLGDAAAISFYPTKNLAALGDGGAVATSDPAVAEAVRSLRQYGWGAKYRIDRSGGRNSRLDEVQAAVLRVRLKRLDERNQRRRAIWARYADALTAGTMIGSHGPEFVAHLAVISVPDRERARSALTELGVSTDVHYPIPDHEQPGTGSSAAEAASLSVTDEMTRHILTVPCFPELTEAEVERVCKALSTL